MPRNYASFLIRCWRLESQEERIKVEHIQSGEATQLDSLEELIAWIEERRKQPPEDKPATQDQPPSAKP